VCSLDAIDEIGYVGRLSGALVSHDIKPLIYLSTFNSDILLVIEHHFESALTVLSQSSLSNAPSSGICEISTTKFDRGDNSSLMPSVELTVRPSVLELCSLNLEKLHSYEHSLIKALIFSDEIEDIDATTSDATDGVVRLFSLTFCLEELTMIASPTIKKLFDPSHLHASNPFTWCTLEVHEGEIGKQKQNKNKKAHYEHTNPLQYIFLQNSPSLSKLGTRRRRGYQRYWQRTELAFITCLLATQTIFW